MCLVGSNLRMGDLLRSFPRCARVRPKCARKSVDLWGQSTVSMSVTSGPLDQGVTVFPRILVQCYIYVVLLINWFIERDWDFFRLRVGEHTCLRRMCKLCPFHWEIRIKHSFSFLLREEFLLLLLLRKELALDYYRHCSRCLITCCTNAKWFCQILLILINLRKKKFRV